MLVPEWIRVRGMVDEQEETLRTSSSTLNAVMPQNRLRPSAGQYFSSLDGETLTLLWRANQRRRNSAMRSHLKELHTTPILGMGRALDPGGTAGGGRYNMTRT